MFKEDKEHGYLVKRTDGNVWQWDLWQAGNGFIDFTNPDVVKWYQDKLKKLLAMGVDCFKTDFRERIPMEDAVYFDGSDPKREHNYYTYQYNKATFDAIAEAKGRDEAVAFARSATVGSQKFPVHWGGDCLSTFKSMSDTLHGGLSFLSSGATILVALKTVQTRQLLTFTSGGRSLVCYPRIVATTAVTSTGFHGTSTTKRLKTAGSTLI